MNDDIDLVEKEVFRILVTDDDSDELFVTSRILTKAGFQVNKASTGDEAIEKTESFKPHLLLLDVVMPDPDGFKVCKRIKSNPEFQDVSIVFLSNFDNKPATKARGLDAGAEDFIERPFNTEEFLSRINSILRVKSIEKKLRRATQNWESLFKAIGQITLITDANHTILEANDITGKKLGRPRRDIIGRKCCEILHNRTSPPSECPMNKAVLTRRGASGTTFLETLSGDYFVSCTPVLDENGQVEKIIHIATDISEVKKIEKDRKRLEEHLQHAQKMEAIGTLAGGIAHDFNNILTSIIGYTELSLEEVESNSELEDNLREIYSAGERAKKIVKQILTFARQTKEKRRTIKVSTIVNEVLSFLKSTAPVTIKIGENISTDGSIQMDPTRLHQVLMNLCTNAVQAMEDTGGRLTVDVCETDSDHSSLNFFSYGSTDRNYVKIAVSDTGQGIPEEIKNKIFEPYFTTKTAKEGTGLGLSTVHGIIKDCNGHITYESEPGEGTVFTLYLPKSEAMESLLNKRNDMPSGTEHILFVDDEAAIVKLGGMILKRLGYRVTTETDSRKALMRFQESPLAFDLVITDMTMPKMTGDQLAREIKKIRPDIPVAMATGYNKKASYTELKELNIDDIFNKPMSQKNMALSVRKLLDAAKKAGRM